MLLLRRSSDPGCACGVKCARCKDRDAERKCSGVDGPGVAMARAGVDLGAALAAGVHEVGVRRQPERLLFEFEVFYIRHIGFVCVADFQIGLRIILATQATVYLLFGGLGYVPCPPWGADYVTIRLSLWSNSSRSDAESATTVI